ncbi:MAG: GNAT family N-acetyltransferase [Candidatus Heimdallarchaeaceae archaeon]
MSISKDFCSPFIGEKVLLRPVEKSDLKDIMKHWNTYETRQYLGHPIPHSSTQEEEWIQSIYRDANRRSSFTFAIVEKEKNEFLGSVSLMNVDWINRTCVFGIAIHNPANHNKGYGSDATRCILKFGFLILNLNRIELEVFEFNQRAVHVYEKLGFKHIGRRRKARFYEGKYYDIILMDILIDEYLELYK